MSHKTPAEEAQSRLTGDDTAKTSDAQQADASGDIQNDDDKVVANFRGKLSANIVKTVGAPGDGTFIQMIIDAIMKLVGMCTATQSPAQVAATMRRPGLFAKLQVRNAVINEVGRAKWRKHGDDNLAEAIYATGREATKEEAVAFVGTCAKLA